MFCLNCGFELPDSANFCLSCGKAQKEGNKQTKHMATLDVESSQQDGRTLFSEVRCTNEKVILDLYDCVKRKVSEINPYGLEYKRSETWGERGLSTILKSGGTSSFRYATYRSSDKSGASILRLVTEELVMDGWTLQPFSTTDIGRCYKTQYIFVKSF